MKKYSYLLGCLLLFSVAGHAQILIGQTAGFTGPVADGVREAAQGAAMYLDLINSQGGVNGQKISLVQLDDRFDPKQAAENARVLIEEKHVSAMFLSRGTPQTEAIIPMLEKHGVALVAPSTGAAVLREPVQKFVFNVRAAYQTEARKLVAHFATSGMTRIAVVYADDSFGKDAVAGAQQGFDLAKVKPVAMEKYSREKPDFATVAAQIQSANPQVVVMFASGTTVVEGVKAIRNAGINPQFATLSNNASSGFAKSIGAGVVVSQVFPSERSVTIALVKEISTVANSNNKSNAISPSMMEGFAGAKVLVEGLRRSGPNPSREKIRVALESINNFDLGGFNVSYSPTNHLGLDFSQLSVTSATGKFIR